MHGQIGLANRRLQPLGHLSGCGNSYSFGAFRSNRTCDSGDSGDSRSALRAPKSGHNGSREHVVDQRSEIVPVVAAESEKTPIDRGVRPWPDTAHRSQNGSHDFGDLATYIADHYGRCRVSPCNCLRAHVWLGRGCRHWEPTTARNWEELKAEQQKMYEAGR